MQRHEVTAGEYLAFLNDPETIRRLRDRDENKPLILVPRLTWDSPESLWDFQDGRFVLRYRESARAWQY